MACKLKLRKSGRIPKSVWKGRFNRFAFDRQRAFVMKQSSVIKRETFRLTGMHDNAVVSILLLVRPICSQPAIQNASNRSRVWGFYQVSVKHLQKKRLRKSGMLLGSNPLARSHLKTSVG